MYKHMKGFLENTNLVTNLVQVPKELNLEDFHGSINTKVLPSKGTCENVLRHQGTHGNL